MTEEQDAAAAEPPAVVEEPAAAADPAVEAEAADAAPPAKRRRKPKIKDDAGLQRTGSMQSPDGAGTGQEALPNVPLWRLQRKEAKSRRWTRKW